MTKEIAMHPSAIIMLTFMAVFYGANCNIFLHEGLTGTKQHQRQTPSQVQCIAEKIDSYFPGNTSSFVVTCAYQAVQRVQLDLSSGAALQQQLEPFYNAYCNRECGNAINDAYNECGAYASVFPGTERLNVALCGTNNEGTKCYLLYGKAFDLIETERDCYTALSSRGCTCQSDIQAGVEEQGCCIDAYYDFISGLTGTYSPRALHSDCNVNFPTDGCDNSPVSLSSYTENFMSIVVSTAAVMITLYIGI